MLSATFLAERSPKNPDIEAGAPGVSPSEASPQTNPNSCAFGQQLSRRSGLPRLCEAETDTRKFGCKRIRIDFAGWHVGEADFDEQAAGETKLRRAAVMVIFRSKTGILLPEGDLVGKGEVPA